MIMNAAVEKRQSMTVEQLMRLEKECARLSTVIVHLGDQLKPVLQTEMPEPKSPEKPMPAMPPLVSALAARADSISAMAGVLESISNRLEV